MDYYLIEVSLPSNIQHGLHTKLFSQIEKDGVYISPHVSLCGSAKAAYVESAELANKYIQSCLPIFKRRYGDDVILEAIKVTSSGSSAYAADKKLFTCIMNDSLIISARIDQNILAPNRNPILSK